MAEIERRPIKFRAWDRTKNRWFYPPDKMDSHLGDFSMTGDGRVYVEGLNQDLTLCQFTGLHDRNGTEIYEGDIIRSLEGDYVVKWFDCDEEARQYAGTSANYPKNAPAVGFGFLLLRGEWDHKDFKLCYFKGRNEVMGNIFQNGDLLNAQD